MFFLIKLLIKNISYIVSNNHDEKYRKYIYCLTQGVFQSPNLFFKFDIEDFTSLFISLSFF